MAPIVSSRFLALAVALPVALATIILGALLGMALPLAPARIGQYQGCLLYTSDAADE